MRKEVEEKAAMFLFSLFLTLKNPGIFCTKYYFQK